MSDRGAVIETAFGMYILLIVDNLNRLDKGRCQGEICPQKLSSNRIRSETSNSFPFHFPERLLVRVAYSRTGKKLFILSPDEFCCKAGLFQVLET